MALLVAAAIIISDGKILLTRRLANTTYPGLWEFPGGKVEPGEDPKDTVVREIQEELDIDVCVTGIYDVVYHRYPEQDVIILAYCCRWLSGTVEDLQVAAHRWVLPEEISAFELLPADIPLAYRIATEFHDEHPPCL